MPLSVLTKICELAEIGTVQKSFHLVEIQRHTRIGYCVTQDIMLKRRLLVRIYCLLAKVGVDTAENESALGVWSTD